MRVCVCACGWVYVHPQACHDVHRDYVRPQGVLLVIAIDMVAPRQGNADTQPQQSKPDWVAWRKENWTILATARVWCRYEVEMRANRQGPVPLVFEAASQQLV